MLSSQLVSQSEFSGFLFLIVKSDLKEQIGRRRHCQLPFFNITNLQTSLASGISHPMGRSYWKSEDHIGLLFASVNTQQSLQAILKTVVTEENHTIMGSSRVRGDIKEIDIVTCVAVSRYWGHFDFDKLDRLKITPYRDGCVLITNLYI